MSRLSIYLHAFSSIKHSLKMKSMALELGEGVAYKGWSGLENRKKRDGQDGSKC